MEIQQLIAEKIAKDESCPYYCLQSIITLSSFRNLKNIVQQTIQYEQSSSKRQLLTNIVQGSKKWSPNYLLQFHSILVKLYSLANIQNRFCFLNFYLKTFQKSSSVSQKLRKAQMIVLQLINKHIQNSEKQAFLNSNAIEWFIIKKHKNMVKQNCKDEIYEDQSRQNYSKISKSTKLKLIRLVIENKSKVSSAAKILKINQSTAKMIVRKFKAMDVQRQKQFYAEAQQEINKKKMIIKSKQTKVEPPKIEAQQAPVLFVWYFFNGYPLCYQPFQ